MQSLRNHQLDTKASESCTPVADHKRHVVATHMLQQDVASHGLNSNVWQWCLCFAMGVPALILFLTPWLLFWVTPCALMIRAIHALVHDGDKSGLIIFKTVFVPVMACLWLAFQLQLCMEQLRHLSSCVSVDAAKVALAHLELQHARPIIRFSAECWEWRRRGSGDDSVVERVTTYSRQHVFVSPSNHCALALDSNPPHALHSIMVTKLQLRPSVEFATADAEQAYTCALQSFCAEVPAAEDCEITVTVGLEGVPLSRAAGRGVDSSVHAGSWFVLYSSCSTVMWCLSLLLVWFPACFALVAFGVLPYFLGIRERLSSHELTAPVEMMFVKHQCYHVRVVLS